MNVSTFYEKLNKVDGNVYVVEEAVYPTDGVYEGELQHDNINAAAFAVYTGPKLTGKRLETYTLSTPSLAPWKRVVKIYAEEPVVYISYETEGDRVEADDINRLQEAVRGTQEAVNAEETRAKAAEQANSEAVDAECLRAVQAETAIQNTISDNKPIWDDKYSRSEVDNKFSDFLAETDWKASVNTYSDLFVTYPDPNDGWTVNVRDTDYTYRWNGSAWIAVSANAIPKATRSEDGLLGKEDKANYDDAYNKRHDHSNKNVLSNLTQDMLDKLTGIAEGANRYVHPTESGMKHIPAGGSGGQILRWAEDGTAVWGPDYNTTYSELKGATASAAGTSGLVPAPAAGKQEQFLRGDGTWAVPPNTGYTHPDSGVAAGTYKSVTVNVQGHVTAGTNPSTLAGFGITDAAAKNHNHDSSYLKKGAVSWNDLKGV